MSDVTEVIEVTQVTVDGLVEVASHNTRMVVSGCPAPGKLTLLRAMLESEYAAGRIVMIEETR